MARKTPAEIYSHIKNSEKLCSFVLNAIVNTRTSSLSFFLKKGKLLFLKNNTLYKMSIMSSFPPSLSPSNTPRHWGFYSGVSFKGHLWMLVGLKRSLINFNLNEFATDRFSLCADCLAYVSKRFLPRICR